MQNMLVMPTKEELATFKPDFTIYNAGTFPCNRHTEGMTSSSSVAMHFRRGEMVILGTEYAGEMKKGILTLMMYLMPLQKQLCLHSSANEDEHGRVSVFFGLSGTGKTTLSADPRRKLIGDDEHVWTDEGVFNVEGGCYAKCIALSEENEPDIFRAIRFGAVVENVVFDEVKREIDYDDISITENTRCAYPLDYIPNAKLPAVGQHPNHVILLTCDGYGVLPPVSKLNKKQVIYHFISGYTSKMAGTEEGITKPVAAFSACYGEPFLVWHPVKYATMLAERLEQHDASAWLLNTGYHTEAILRGLRLSCRGYHAEAISPRRSYKGCLTKAIMQRLSYRGYHAEATIQRLPYRGYHTETISQRLPYRGYHTEVTIQRLSYRGCLHVQDGWAVQRESVAP